MLCHPICWNKYKRARVSVCVCEDNALFNVHKNASESIEFHYAEYTIAANMNSDIIHHSFLFVMYSTVLWIMFFFLFGMSVFLSHHSPIQFYSSLLWSLGINSMVFTTGKWDWSVPYMNFLNGNRERMKPSLHPINEDISFC